MVSKWNQNGAKNAPEKEGEKRVQKGGPKEKIAAPWGAERRNAQADGEDFGGVKDQLWAQKLARALQKKPSAGTSRTGGLI